MSRHRTIFQILVLVPLPLISGLLLTVQVDAVERGEPYTSWLHDVTWIISELETEAFDALQSDAERDLFIRAFWDARDPTPGTPQNEFREEHYRRLDYANTRFRSEGKPGWKTDRGRIYILLGPPFQIKEFQNRSELYPVQLWFYTNLHRPTLPSHFYLLFYQRQGFGSWDLYSPHHDGPAALTYAKLRTRRGVYNYMAAIDAELARAAFSYLPGDSPEYSRDSGSLSSELLLNSIRRLPEAEVPADYVARFLPEDSELRQRVTTRVSYRIAPLQAVFLPVVNDDGQVMLHYALQIDPRHLAVMEYDNRRYLSLEIRLAVTSRGRGEVARHVEEFIHYFDDPDWERIRTAPFFYAGKMGFISGEYSMELLVLNRADSAVFQLTRDMAVPFLPIQSPSLSPPLPVVRLENADPEKPCFTFNGIQFLPQLTRAVFTGDPLVLLFQLYYPPDKARAEADESLTLEYRLLLYPDGREVMIRREEVPKSRIDRTGTRLHLQSVPVQDLPDGRYSLVVTLRETSGQLLDSLQYTFSATRGRRPEPPQRYLSGSLAPDSAGRYDYQRAVMLLRMDQPDDAYRRLQIALIKDPRLTAAAVELARLELERDRAPQALATLNRFRAGPDFPLAGYLLLGRIHLALDQPAEARQALLTFLETAEPSSDQFAQLARLFRQLGDLDKAREMEAHAAGGGPPNQ
ncbi:MAG: GWxTD domain-containing protein [Acidobacteria bacterium]|nr:GWxTD domain-containing protein [Acidobacteriota bacterium]